MASAAPSSNPSGGVSSSMWAGQPPNRQGRGQSGSGFRGVSRGRPGRGGGRGGRGGGRGGSRTAGPNSPRPDDRAPKPNGVPAKDTAHNTPPPVSVAPNAPAPANETQSPTSSKAATQSKDTKPRARKPSEAKPPRKVIPPIVIQPPPVAASNSPVSATTPNRSRRKRSQNRSMSSVSSSKKSPSSESSTSHLRAEKSPVIAKDLPPHLAPPPPPETPSFDIRHDIDALVERVRAVAMDRPNTPGSHIDWAGDDDDSLPDLDDWGVKSVTDKSTSNSMPEPSGKPDLLSPMLADALKPLPSIDLGSPLAEPTVRLPHTAPAAQPPAKGAVGDNTPQGPPASSKSNSKDRSVPEKPPAIAPKKQLDRKKSDASAKPVAAPALPSKPSVEQAAALNLSPTKQTNAPLHPSLPAKPVDAIDALAERVPRKPLIPVQTPDPAIDVDPPPQSGLSESMHAPKPNGLAAPEPPSDSPSPEPQGVAASMHAHVHSAPSHITSHIPATHSMPNFHPGHGRAHTMGRPRDLRVPFGPHDGQDERASRRDRVNHARTHSSPPTGPGTSTARSRTVHATRPVIAAAALSGIARALGGPPPPKRDAGSVAAVSKD